MSQKPKHKDINENGVPEEPENAGRRKAENLPEPDPDDSSYYYDDAYGYEKYLPEESEDEKE